MSFSLSSSSLLVLRMSSPRWSGIFGDCFESRTSRMTDRNTEIERKNHDGRCLQWQAESLNVQWLRVILYRLPNEALSRPRFYWQFAYPSIETFVMPQRFVKLCGSLVLSLTQINNFTSTGFDATWAISSTFYFAPIDQNTAQFYFAAAFNLEGKKSFEFFRLLNKWENLYRHSSYAPLLTS